jgi:uncharacterized lipoprotein NlpE involved in copper resistance
MKTKTNSTINSSTTAQTARKKIVHNSKGDERFVKKS